MVSDDIVNLIHRSQKERVKKRSAPLLLSSLVCAASGIRNSGILGFR